MRIVFAFLAPTVAQVLGGILGSGEITAASAIGFLGLVGSRIARLPCCLVYGYNVIAGGSTRLKFLT